jgi:hypothetical protein
MLFYLENGNHNGDPDAGNMPRVDAVKYREHRLHELSRLQPGTYGQMHRRSDRCAS